MKAEVCVRLPYMLRRVARVLRTGLLLAGMMFLVLIPISSFAYFDASLTWPRWELASIIIHLGRFEVRWVSGAPEHIRSGVGFVVESPRAPVSWVPEVRAVSSSHWRWRSAAIPLWLL